MGRCTPLSSSFLSPPLSAVLPRPPQQRYVRQVRGGRERRRTADNGRDRNDNDNGVHLPRDWSGSLLHVLGCEGERDVISQLVRVRSVRLIGGGDDDDDGTDDKRGNRLAIRADLPGSALPLQGFYLVNVDRGLLDEGEFYHDVDERTVYAHPPLITAPDLEDLLLKEGATASVLDELLHISSSSDVTVSNPNLP